VNQGRVVKDVIIRQGCAGGDDGVAQLADEIDADSVVGYANTGGFSFGQHHFGHHFRPLEDEGIRAWKQAFHGAVCIVGYFGIATDVFKPRADKAEGFLVHDIAADTVECISWVGNDASLSEGIRHLADKSFLRVDGVDVDQHKARCLLRSLLHVKMPKIYDCQRPRHLVLGWQTCTQCSIDQPLHPEEGKAGSAPTPIQDRRKR